MSQQDGKSQGETTGEPFAARAEALAANPDNEADEAERLLESAPPSPVELAANPDNEEELAERIGGWSGPSGRREALAANPDNEADEADRHFGGGVHAGRREELAAGEEPAHLLDSDMVFGDRGRSRSRRRR